MPFAEKHAAMFQTLSLKNSTGEPSPPSSFTAQAAAAGSPAGKQDVSGCVVVPAVQGAP